MLHRSRPGHRKWASPGLSVDVSVYNTVVQFVLYSSGQSCPGASGGAAGAKNDQVQGPARGEEDISLQVHIRTY